MAAVAFLVVVLAITLVAIGIEKIRDRFPNLRRTRSAPLVSTSTTETCDRIRCCHELCSIRGLDVRRRIGRSANDQLVSPARHSLGAPVPASGAARPAPRAEVQRANVPMCEGSAGARQSRI